MTYPHLDLDHHHDLVLPLPLTLDVHQPLTPITHVRKRKSRATARAHARACTRRTTTSIFRQCVQAFSNPSRNPNHALLANLKSGTNTSITNSGNEAGKGESHACDVCGKTFKRRYNLKVHGRKHNNEKPYHCAHCNETFKWRSSLRHHMKTNHQDKDAKLPKPVLNNSQSLLNSNNAHQLINHLIQDNPSTSSTQLIIQHSQDSSSQVSLSNNNTDNNNKYQLDINTVSSPLSDFIGETHVQTRKVLQTAHTAQPSQVPQAAQMYFGSEATSAAVSAECATPNPPHDEHVHDVYQPTWDNSDVLIPDDTSDSISTATAIPTLDCEFF